MRSAAVWSIAADRTTAALASGALCPIDTDQVVVKQEGIEFVVRWASRGRGPGSTGPSAQADPFSPPDPELVVGHVSETHICVLNKFNVLPLHLLLVTRELEAQETLLTLADFEALWSCLEGPEALAFYNSSRRAGASQPHKHLQVVPLPLTGGAQPTPIHPAVARGELPYPHALAPTPAEASQARARYLELLEQIGRADPPAPYNLLLTREWMLAVPRTVEGHQGVSVNALGFAGSLFARDREGIALIRRLGPVALLRRVSGLTP